MIIKILSSTGTFAGVKYNTDKIKNEKGELLHVGNMPHVDGLNISEKDCKEYFVSHSSSNTRVKNSQFHAVISADGDQLDKFQLKDIAEKYLDKMGYGSNPYIIVFHNDTDNNHVHIVSSRVDHNGTRINDSYENLRTNNIRKELMEEYSIVDKTDLDSLLDYKFQTSNQLVHLLKSNGYVVDDSDKNIKIYYNGELKKELDKSLLVCHEIDKKRALQIKALITKYSTEYNTQLEPVHKKLKGDRLGEVINYRSDLGDFLKSKFGLNLHYHFSGDKKPYGYSVIDHSKKLIFKGSDILKLSLIINPSKPLVLKDKQSKEDALMKKLNGYNINNLNHIQALSRYYKIPEFKLSLNNNEITDRDKNFYKVLLNNHFEKDSWANLNKLQITPISINGELLLLDKSNLFIIDAKDCLDSTLINDYHKYDIDGDNEIEHHQEESLNVDLGWDIADDQDDEMVHGKKRNKSNRKR